MTPPREGWDSSLLMEPMLFYNVSCCLFQLIDSTLLTNLLIETLKNCFNHVINVIQLSSMCCIDHYYNYFDGHVRQPFVYSRVVHHLNYKVSNIRLKNRSSYISNHRQEEPINTAWQKTVDHVTFVGICLNLVNSIIKEVLCGEKV